MKVKIEITVDINSARAAEEFDCKRFEVADRVRAHVCSEAFEQLRGMGVLTIATNSAVRE